MFGGNSSVKEEYIIKNNINTKKQIIKQYDKNQIIKPGYEILQFKNFINVFEPFFSSDYQYFKQLNKITYNDINIFNDILKDVKNNIKLIKNNNSYIKYLKTGNIDIDDELIKQLKSFVYNSNCLFSEIISSYNKSNSIDINLSDIKNIFESVENNKFYKYYNNFTYHLSYELFMNTYNWSLEDAIKEQPEIVFKFKEQLKYQLIIGLINEKGYIENNSMPSLFILDDRFELYEKFKKEIDDTIKSYM